MKIVWLPVVLFFILQNPCNAKIKIVDKNSEKIYTNIDSANFFRRAFAYRNRNNLSKGKIMEIIKKVSYKYAVNPKIALSIAKVESDFQPSAVSSSGAVGVMQLMDKTARSYGVKDMNSVEENIEGGVKFLKHLTEKYKDIRLVAAAYNAGETAVDKYKGIPPYYETMHYVDKFLTAYGIKHKKYSKVRRKVYHCKPVVKIGNTYSNIGKLW